MTRRRSLLAAGFASITSSAWLVPDIALAHSYALGPLHIEHPYATPSVPGAPGAGYIRLIRNAGSEPDRLVSARTPVAASVELHSVVRDGEVMRMREVAHIEIPARGELPMRHDSRPGFHLMLVGLREPLKLRDRIPMRLRFERAGEVDVVMVVQAPKDGAESHRH